MRGKNSMLICLAIALLSAPMVVNVSFAETLPEMSVSPETTVSSSGQFFTIQVYLKDAVEVSAWEFKLTWDLDLTYFPPTATEGTFLKPYATYFAASPSILYKNILVGCFMTVPGSKSGSGVLTSITFQIRNDNSGSSPLDLYDTKLWDATGNLIEHTVKDGSFYTTNPKVIFSWTPATPMPGEIVTFDGTASYDPDGGDIIYYLWDFGDGSPTDDTGGVVTHTYTSYKFDPYQVTLTIMDDDYEVWYLTKPLRIWRDVAVVSVWPSMDEWDSTHFSGYQTQTDPYDMYGELWILVTVVNFGTVPETFDVAVSVDGTDYNGMAYHFEPYPYLRANRVLQPYAGSGWSYWFVLDVSYGAQVWGTNDPVPPGQYTITATLTDPLDQDPTNNVMTTPFGLHGPTEVTKIVRGAMARDKIYRLSKGPITFGGFIKNFDNTYDILRTPDDQGEWGRIAFDIMDESGALVEQVTTPAVYLNYLEFNMDQLKAVWENLAVGKYTVNAYAQFGINGETFPYWGENTYTFNFVVIP